MAIGRHLPRVADIRALTAGDWNRLVEEVERLAALGVAPPLQLSNQAVGHHIAVDIDGLSERLMDDYVEIDVVVEVCPIFETSPSGITRMPLGTAHRDNIDAEGPQTLTLSGITLSAGTMLVVNAGVYFNTGSSSGLTLSATWNGSPMLSATGTIDDGTATAGEMFYLPITVAGTGDVVVTVDNGVSHIGTMVLNAVAVANLGNNLLDVAASATGSDSHPDSTATSTTATADEFWEAAVIYLGDLADLDAGVWQHSFTDGSQGVEGVGGSGSQTLALGDAYRIVSATGTSRSEKVGVGASGDWIALTATFR